MQSVVFSTLLAKVVLEAQFEGCGAGREQKYNNEIAKLQPKECINKSTAEYKVEI